MGDLDEAQQARSVGRYLLYDAIAAGGMATVHFGRLGGPAGFSRTVAIKRLHPQFARDPELVAAFLDEARLAVRVRHPNVVSTLEVVVTPGEVFLVMDYVEGETLSRLVRAERARGGAVDPRIVATIMTGVLHGLHAAHEAADERGGPLGIVHRDVSPQNIIVGVDGVARVLDFGVAKAVARLQTTRAGEIKGKIAYTPPERFLGSTLTPQADVYAAAVVMWEALTGRRLFKNEDDSDAAIIAAITSGRVLPPSELAPGAPTAFDEIAAKGLDRDLNQRYASAREMALDLEARVGLASTFAVGQWVQSLAAVELAERADRVRAIESTSEQGASLDDVLRSVRREEPAAREAEPPPLGPVAPSTPVGPPPPVASSRVDRAKRRTMTLVAAAGLALLALLVTGVVRLRAGERAAKRTPAAEARGPGPPAPVAVDVAPEIAPAAPPSATSVEVVPRAHRKAPTLTATSRRPPPPVLTAGPAPSCVARFDENGRKHWECQ